jgi:ketosteroid isomerase-like protein
MLALARGGLCPSVAAVAGEMTEERLHEALAAWNTADVERVLEFWSDDCVYHASFGPELMGRTFAGRHAAREGIQEFFDRYPDGEFADTEVMVAGSRGAAEWTFRATGDDGQPFEVRGCDLFEFEGDLIWVKNAFRKVLETLD